MKKAIQMFPHSRADFLANLASVFASPADAFHDRKRSFRIRYQRKQNPLWVDVVRSRAWGQRGNRAKPTLFRGKLCGIQNQTVGRLEHTRGIVRPLEIAAHPVQTVGDAGKHSVLYPILLTLNSARPRCLSNLHLETNSLPVSPFATPLGSGHQAQ